MWADLASLGTGKQIKRRLYFFSKYDMTLGVWLQMLCVLH